MAEKMIATEISKVNLMRLEQFAKGFGKTPNDAIGEALSLAEAALGILPSGAAGPQGAKAEGLPDLSHTTVLAALVDGSTMPRGQHYWNNIMHEAMRKAAAKGKSPKEIFEQSSAHVSMESRSDNGFKFIPEAGVSVQGQDSNNAWKQIRQMAQLADFEVSVEFRWQNNPKAERPGEVGNVHT